MVILLTGCLPEVETFAVESDGGVLDAGPDGGSTPPDPRPDATVDATDAGFDGGRPPEQDATVDAGADASVPVRDDVECALWGAMGPSRCTRRVSRPLEYPLVEPADLAISRRDNHIAMAFNSPVFADQGHMELRRFDIDSLATIDSETLEGFLGDQVGTAIAMSTSPNVTHIAYWLRSDFGSEIRYLGWRDLSLGTPEIVSSTVSRGGRLDIAASSDARALVAYHDDVDAQFRVREREDLGTWLDIEALSGDAGAPTPGTGDVAIALDSVGAPHVAFQAGAFTMSSRPRYCRRAGGVWTMPRTLDNHRLDTLSGDAIDIELFGERRFTAFVDWSDGISEVRLVDFVSPDELSPPQVLERFDAQEIPHQHPLVLQMDQTGARHVVFLALGTANSLEWHREHSSGGSTVWLRDTIDNDVGSAESFRLDFAIDPDGRPHIVYYAEGELHYATELVD